MIGGTGNENQTDDSDLQPEREMDETIVLTEEPVADSISDTAEFQVEKLVEKLESGELEETEQKREVKRRLEELQEEIGDNLDSTYNINLDDDD